MSGTNFSKLDKKQGAGGSSRPSMLLISNALLVTVNFSCPDRAPTDRFQKACYPGRHAWDQYVNDRYFIISR